jgi:DNA invertase Pin-like site-specific DNA recombinase
MKGSEKVQSCHLARRAYLYVRRTTFFSNPSPEGSNTESTQRQYALKERAVALGWPADQVVVIDSDLGQPGTSNKREGFQKLVREVRLGHAGIVMAHDVSRLARNFTDWQSLSENCAQTDTLILLDDQIYDLAEGNDRLVLGLKGILSAPCCRQPRKARGPLSATVTPAAPVHVLAAMTLDLQQ